LPCRCQWPERYRTGSKHGPHKPTPALEHNHQTLECTTEVHATRVNDGSNSNAFRKRSKQNATDLHPELAHAIIQFYSFLHAAMSTRAWHRFRKTAHAQPVVAQLAVAAVDPAAGTGGSSARYLGAESEPERSRLLAPSAAARARQTRFRATGSHVGRKAGSPSWNVRFASNCWRSIS